MYSYKKWLAGVMIAQLVVGCSSGGGGESNSAPVVSNISSTTLEDTTKAITLAGTDANSDTLTYTIVANPTKGSITLAGNSVTYKPNANVFGADSFTYKANDGQADSNTATVTINVTAVNDAPTVNALSASLNEDASSVVTLTGSDVEGTTLVFSIVTAPSHGRVTLIGNKATYIPNANYFGADSFTYKASDGQADSASATVSLTINPVADAPVAQDINVTVLEDTAQPITLLGSDVDSTNLTYSLVANPQFGSAKLVNNIVTYTPTPDFALVDSFTYKVSDGALTSATKTVFTTMTPVNDPPLADPFVEAATSYEAKSFDLRGSDVDDLVTTRTATITVQPQHGTVSLNGLRATYTSAVYYDGLDFFKYTLSDGKATSNEAQVTLLVSLPPPVAPTPTGKLNDTGAVTCANASASNLSCPVTTHPNQDADNGRDITHADNSDGKLGFSFTKIDSRGLRLPIQTNAWSNTGTEVAGTKWACVKDNVTGLIWEIKPDDGGLHDKDWTYTWYNPDNTKNGGDTGVQSDATTCSSLTSCDTSAYINAVNQAKWCGANDWRLPTITELANLAILEPDMTQPLGIDTHYFPDLPMSDRFYWSANSTVDAASAFVHTFNYFRAYNAVGFKAMDKLYVRLVRDGQ